MAHVVSSTAHPTPHRPAPRPGAGKPRPGAPRHRHSALRLVLILAAAALAAWAAWHWRPGAGSTDPMEKILDQMQAAAEGTVAPTHAFGGALTVTRANGRVNVTAENLPSRACVQVGWRLAKEGTIIVNGILPMRLSAAKLSELCSEGEKGATLTWVPEE